MALLVTDQGEIDSLRTLLNATHEIPRNLILKLYTGPAIPPTEQDVPSSSKYFEPYNATNSSGYGSGATTGYPVCINNRTEENQDFSQNYGILLNGNQWTIATTTAAEANITPGQSLLPKTRGLSIDPVENITSLALIYQSLFLGVNLEGFST